MKLNVDDLKSGLELTLELESGVIELGREAIKNYDQQLGPFAVGDQKISIFDDRISRKHGIFSYNGKSLAYTDTNSKHGTYWKEDGDIVRTSSGVPHTLASGAELYFLPREEGYRYRIRISE